MATTRRKLRKTLTVRAKDDCTMCEGTGLKVSNVYYSASRKLEVTIEVCPCVRVTAGGKT